MFRSASNELRNDNETLASYVDLAGDQMRRLADHIRERGVADMLDDVHAFARRRPALFIGGAFVVGLGLARFLKSSADRGPLRQYGNFSRVDPMTAGAGSPSYSGDMERSAVIEAAPMDVSRDRSIGELVSDLSSQTSELIRQELRLAKAELSAKLSDAGWHVALIGVAIALVWPLSSRSPRRSRSC